MVKSSWLGRYEATRAGQRFRRIVLSCDPAGKAGLHNDYTAIVIVGIDDKRLHILQVARGHWTVLAMRDQIRSLAAQWQADLVLVEDTSSGMGLIQLLKEQSRMSVVGRHPKSDKETRMLQHQGKFEAMRASCCPLRRPGWRTSRSSSWRGAFSPPGRCWAAVHSGGVHSITCCATAPTGAR
jgi:predicted phage terminase large subunit-like protein